MAKQGFYEAKMIAPSKITLNPDNPQVFTDDDIEELQQNIEKFKKGLWLRPIVVDENNMILGGNKRYLACKQLKMRQIPIIYAHDLTEEEKKHFIILDNRSFGQWDYVKLGEWDKEITDWHGLTPPDLDNPEEEEAPKEPSESKSIKLEMEHAHFEELKDLMKYFKNRGGNPGEMFLNHLRATKSKLID